MLTHIYSLYVVHACNMGTEFGISAATTATTEGMDITMCTITDDEKLPESVNCNTATTEGTSLGLATLLVEPCCTTGIS